MARCAEFAAAHSLRRVNNVAPHSLQWIKRMATIHDEIDNWLAGELHGELSDEERSALHAHLVDCAACRKTHQETKLMNKILEDTLAQEKADPVFEQRMLAGFRRRVPQRSGFVKLLNDLIRLRAVQITAVAAVLLALVQVGRMITGESATMPRGREDYAKKELFQQPSRFAASEPARAGALDKSDELAAGRPQAVPLQAPPPSSSVEAKDKAEAFARAQAPTATESNLSATENAAPKPAETPAPELANRKLIRNATVHLEIVSFDDAVQKITAFAKEERGYVATTDSQKQANGKLRGSVVVKVLPENLDRFLQKIRGLGELKNQTLGTEDVTKAYFDTDARLKNAHVMEQRLIEMLKTKTGKVSDLLQVEKELGRVREDIEKMQGELKYWDSQVQFATVTISLVDKDMEDQAAFLLKEHSQIALYVNDVEKIYNDVKTLASPKVQITNAQLDRDNAGRVAAHLSMLIVPEESDAVVSRVKGMGRVENFQVQTERVAQGGNGMSENAKTKRDKIALNITISRETDEQPVQETSLRILTSNVDQNAARLKADAVKSGAEIRDSTFSRDPDGREVANIFLRLPMKNYAAMMKSLNQLGAMKDVSVQRHDKIDKNASEENAPADISIQIYSRGNIVSSDTGLFATLRNTIAQGLGP